MIYRFGDYEFPEYGAADDEQFHDGKSALSNLPASDGAWDHLGDDGYKAAGTVVHRFILLGTTFEDLDDQEDEMLAAMNQGRQKLYWRMRGGGVRWAWAKKRSVSMPPAGDRTRLTVPVSVTFEIASPYRYNNYPASGAEWGDFEWDGGAEWGGGVTTSFAFSIGSPTFTINNPGNAPALAVITISCAAGQSAENVKLNRKVGGSTVQYFQATRIIAATKSLVVDCAAYSVEYDGADDYDNLTIGANQVEWMHLEPGDNSMEVVCAHSGDAGTIEFEFYPPYH
jgi:hypothetical protein